MVRYTLRSMKIKVPKPTPVFVDNMSVVLNATNHVSTLIRKIVALIYHFVRGHVANNGVEMSKIHTRENFAETFTKPLVINDFHWFYHDFMLNR